MHTIFLQIRNKIQTVQITEVFNPAQSMVYIEFENGYGNIFFVDCESGKWVEQDLGFTRLAEIIGNELAFVIKSKEGSKRTMQWIGKSINGYFFHFGFYKCRSGLEQVYEIFAGNRRYMFSLVKKSDEWWQIFTMPGANPWDYNIEYFEIVPYLLDELEV